MFKKLLLLASLVLPVVSTAADLTVSNVTITKVQVYETADESVNVWLHVNGSSRIGPNPENSNETCELWTNDSTVYSTALAALMSGKKVTIRYVDRGEGTYWCIVKDLAVNSS